MDGLKRKRDDEGTIVTFYAPNRTFARVYKGQSLSETKELVRRKLGLADDASIRFARLHEGKVIELDDDDDFEAFRHLARYVTSLDVSVFVGQDAPSIFTEQHSRDTSAVPKPNNKRLKKPHPLTSSSIISSNLVSSSRSSTADPTPRLPATTSTVDANGMPRTKRHRKGHSPVDRVPLRGPGVELQDIHRVRAEGPVRGEAARDQQHWSQPAPVSTPVILLPSSTDNVATSSSDAAVPPRGSKRKRHDSPEPSSPVPAVPPSSPPSRLPSTTKKKRKKDKVLADTTTQVEGEEVLSRQTAKSDKKGKRKERDVTETSGHLDGMRATAGQSGVLVGETTDAKKSGKKAEQDAKPRLPSETGPDFPQNMKQSKKRKHKDAPTGETVEGIRAAESVPDTMSRPSTGAKEKSKVEVPRVTSEALPTVNASSVTVPLPIDTTAAKEKTEKRSKTKLRQNGQDVSASADPQASVSDPATSVRTPQASADGKRTKRRQTIQNVDVAGEPSIADVITTPLNETVAPGVMSVKAAKRDRKSLPASSEDSTGPSPAAMAALQAAFDAVMARGHPASSVQSTAPAPIPLLAPPMPGRKRNTGRSKLSKAWGPDDLADDPQSSASAPPPAAVQSVTENHKPSAVVDIAAQSQVKTAIKKARKSSAPTCPVCEQAAVHPRSECPVVTAGASSLRKRIAQLRKDGVNIDLVEELSDLLKGQRRRRTTTTAVTPTPPIAISATTSAAGDVPPSSPELPLQSLSTAAPRRPSLPKRPLPSPRLPAGSEISEVAVESKDEGSSNESSSSDDEDNVPAPRPIAIMPDHTDLEALLWGPAKPRASILAQIPSSESESDTDSEESNDEDVDLEEEEKNDRAYRRLSRKLERAGSSSDDEQEPQPEPVDPDMDVDDIIIPPTTMDPDPNNSIEDAREVEADVLAREDSALLRGAVGSDKEEGEEKDDEFTEEETREMLIDPEAADDESEEEEAAPTKPSSEREGSSASESGESRAVSGPDASSADRVDPDRVERAAEVDPLVSQETPDGAVAETEAAQPQGADDEREESGDDTASAKGEPVAVSPALVGESASDTLETAMREPVADLVDDSNQPYGDRELSPEIGGHVPTSPAPAPAPSPPVEDDEDDATAVQVDVVEPHSEDPDDPIGSFGSVSDQERRNDLEAEDPIEDPDASQSAAEARVQTPPPATPRTPGTVSRMKDRYGRLPKARAKDSAPSLSRQLLGDLVLPEAELTLPANGDAEHESAPERVLVEEAAGAGSDVEDPEQTREVEHGEGGIEEPELDTHASRESSQYQEDAENASTRPRRTTRITRRTSTMPPSSSLPEPTSTPTPAPPQRGRPRLTEEQKAQREAEKLEKKAERERKAAVKKAEREAKAAAKRAETEARKAAKLAEKEAKEAAQRALQEEVAKRGARAARGRGRGRGAKPVSTQSQRSVASAGEPEEEEGAEQPRGSQEVDPMASETVPETPAVGKVSWATLSQSGPRTQTESVGDLESSMIDELQPSSPELAPEGRAICGRKKVSSKEDTHIEEPAHEPLDETLGAVTPKPKGMKEPLFIPSSSQVPSRFLPDAESTPFPANDPHESGGEAEGQDTTLRGPPRSRPGWYAQALYPTLTDLASQQLFPATQIPSPALFSQTPNAHAKTLVSAQYAKGDAIGDEDETSDDDDDDSSDSDGEKAAHKSHIPQNRRAGADVQKKKKSGLLSAYK